MERAIWKLDLVAPLNFTTIARVTGPLTIAALRAALPALRARHPFLGARIVTEGATRPVFQFDCTSPLAVKVGSSGWVAELEAELNTRIDADHGPLARFVWVEADSRLLITLHHSIGDGMSGAFLMRDWVSAAAQALAGQTPRLAPLPATVSAEASLPSTARAGATSHHARFLLKELALGARHGLPLTLRHDVPRLAHERRTRVIPVELDAPLTAALLARARAEKTTVHGALSAAMILGAIADTGRSRGNISFGSPVNVRANLAPAVGEDVGFFVSMLAFRDAVELSLPFWELARRVRRQLEDNLARADPMGMLVLFPKAFDLFGINRLSPHALAERVQKLIVATSGLTNLGRLTIATDHGPLRIEDCHFGASPSALGSFLGTATSLNGRLFWNFMWPDPNLTERHATALVTSIVERLEASVAAQP
jgi:hypothetical protein